MAKTLEETEDALATALRDYIAARSEKPFLDDMADDALAAVNQALAEGWKIDVNHWVHEKAYVESITKFS